MTSPVDPSRMPDAVERYLAGESVFALSKSYGIDRGAIKRRLELAGVTFRTASEQNVIAAARQTPAERKARATAAHDALRGTTTSESTLMLKAKRQEARGKPASEAEERMLAWLQERGETPRLQVAIGRYNVDFAISNIAVEVLGAEWHRYPSRRNHARRTKALLDAGWHVLFVWDTAVYPARPGVADYAVAFAEEMRRNPVAVREYRVIWGDGQTVAAGSLENYDLTHIPPPRHGLTLSEIGRLGGMTRWHGNQRVAGQAESV